MYYVNLGLKGKFDYFYDENLKFRFFFRTDFGVMQSGIEDYSQEFADVGLVKNLSNNIYWSGTTYDGPIVGDPEYINHFIFITNIGRQWMGYPPGGRYYAWAVRDGDVASVAAPIPEPSTYAMLLAGLGLLGLTARRRKQTHTKGVL